MPYYTSFHYTEDLEGQTPAAPEQGFEGEDVQHEDMDTMTGDWRREYGPKGPPEQGFEGEDVQHEDMDT